MEVTKAEAAGECRRTEKAGEPLPIGEEPTGATVSVGRGPSTCPATCLEPLLLGSASVSYYVPHHVHSRLSTENDLSNIKYAHEIKKVDFSNIKR